MTHLKRDKEIKLMAKAGEITAKAMEAVAKKISPGVKTIELDKIAEDTIAKLGAESSFKKVKGYKHTICTTPNDWVVHGIPGEYKLKEGDIIGIDLGAYYKGFHSDMAQTFPVGEISKEAERFLGVGRTALEEAIKKVNQGNRIGDISSTIQKFVEGGGYSVVRELVGHGVGRELHEDPLIPGVGKEGKGPKIEKGMVLAIEVIYNKGVKEIQLLPDQWSITTKDREIAGLFERTVAVTEKGTLVLTPEPKKW